ncbi:MAG: hypothetical protein ABWK01_06510 [Infirmifilum sp.]
MALSARLHCPRRLPHRSAGGEAREGRAEAEAHGGLVGEGEAVAERGGARVGRGMGHPALQAGAVYAAVRVGRLVECRALCEPVEGWVWVSCGDTGALLRDLARMELEGLRSPLATTGGELLDALQVEHACLSGTLEGAYEVHYSNPLEGLAKLVRLGARRAEYRGGRLIADLTGLHVEDLLREGLVPLTWRGRRPSSG